MTEQEIETRFSYHKPDAKSIEKMKALRESFKELAHLINELCPESKEKSSSITSLFQAMAMANASIAHQCPIE